jgi:hypothetical protein
VERGPQWIGAASVHNRNPSPASLAADAASSATSPLRRERRLKIKLRAAGYRLVYRVDDEVVAVVVVAVGRRDRNLVYKIAAGRL